MPDDSSSSAEADPAPDQPWPLTESDVADAEAFLTQVHAMITQIEQTIIRARAYLATLNADAPALRRVLLSADMQLDVPNLADLQAARGLRAELVKAAQQSVTVSQSAARYLQARERFLLARREWAKHTGG